jgi:ATP-dependent helicase Lhr and Lhr-like helicase
MTAGAAGFSAATQAWFDGAFAAPTAAQRGAWEAVAGGHHALVVAPTGSGKTLAAFLWSLDQLLAHPAAPGESPAPPMCRVLYVSPLKALAVDIERNLRAPLTGIRNAAERLGLPVPEITVAMRTGDTTADDRRRFARHPADILITTPESLFLLLTSKARAALAGVETVIVDEVHAVASTKRGAHLALSLERLDALLGHPAQRIGLSATVRPVEEVARFLGGAAAVTVVQPPTPKTLEIRVVVPVPDMSALGESTGEPRSGASAAGAEERSSIWPAVERRIVELIRAHRSTIVFANSRRLAERLCGRLNEIVAEEAIAAGTDAREIARAHHGSVSREQRSAIEEALKAGTLPAVVATSSLELGVDMGAVDLVVQVEAPPSVASGLQRVGRAGHQVGAVSYGVMLPKYRGDLVQCAVVAERMQDGAIEALAYPRNPLDVLAQQVVAMVAMDPWQVDDLAAAVRRAAPYAGLPSSVLEATLDMLAGRYPSDDFAELRPRLVWNRVSGVLTARPGAQRLAVTSGGTIPDRGLFGVFLAGESAATPGSGGRRVGELDEEMVYESRVGDVITLGSSSWRIEEITADRVLVTPAPGQPGKLPFWHGDAPGRPIELGRALGAFVREMATLPTVEARARAHAAGLDDWAASNLLGYLSEQQAATGRLPDDRTILVERFRDELGDWRIAVHSPFGAQVNAPWTLALVAQLRSRYGVQAQAMHSDDGIVLRLPEADEPPAAELVLFAADEVEAAVQTEVGGSALFASRFRECAARSLLLPRRTPGRRTPLWQQRQRSAHLLQVASRFTDFPVVLETMRECLQDVFDVPGLVGLMRDVEARRVRLIEVETPAPSPFARSLLFGYVGAFMYEGDTPLAERRAQALSLDATLLAELLGQAELRELLSADALAEVEAELQRLPVDRHVRDLEGAADLLRLLGDLSTAEAEARGVDPNWLTALGATRRVLSIRIAGQDRWVGVEDAGRLRDALGVPLPVGVPQVFLEPVVDPLGDLIGRYARTHGPFAPIEVAQRLGLGLAVVDTALARLAGQRRVVHGEFRPGGVDLEWCDPQVLRALRRRSLAKLRAEVEPAPPEALARFLPRWQGVGANRSRGPDTLLRVIEQLGGVPVPASALESLVLPSRIADYSPAMLDEFAVAGEILWAGAGSLPGPDGWVSLGLPETADLLLPLIPRDTEWPAAHQAVLRALDGGAALFFRALSERVAALDGPVADAALLETVWDLVWAGLVTNDTLAPLRALLATRPHGRTRAARSTRLRPNRALGGRRSSTGPRAGPATGAGRWSLLPVRDIDPTRRSHALAESLLDRHGILTRGAVVAEGINGGFGAVYPVLKAFEESGRCRRGYFVEGLGGAQFASPGAVDRLRAGPDPGSADGYPAERGEREQPALLLAATDPANPYGAALPWPTRETPADDPSAGHRPGRKAGALVVLIAGALVLYVERGGRSLLSWTDDPDRLEVAARALAGAVTSGGLGRLAVERADGAGVLSSPLGAALEAAGFRPTPRGLRLRA